MAEITGRSLEELAGHIISSTGFNESNNVLCTVFTQFTEVMDYPNLADRIAKALVPIERRRAGGMTSGSFLCLDNREP